VESGRTFAVISMDVPTGAGPLQGFDAGLVVTSVNVTFLEENRKSPQLQIFSIFPPVKMLGLELDEDKRYVLYPAKLRLMTRSGTRELATKVPSFDTSSKA
jgi:hypothetical protein